MCISMEEHDEVCFIQRVSKECNLPSFLAIGCRMCEVDGNLRDGGTTLACPECSASPSLEDTVCSFCLTKSPAVTVKEELHLTTVVIYSHAVFTSKGSAV